MGERKGKVYKMEKMRFNIKARILNGNVINNPVNGYVFGYSGLAIGVYKQNNGSWTAVELTTGASIIYDEPTRKAAVEEAIRVLRLRPEAVKIALAANIERYGAANEAITPKYEYLTAHNPFCA